MTLEQYRAALARHDWWHAYSDDHQVWKRGCAELDALRVMREALDPDFQIWNEHAPDEMKVAIK
jgi:hypothetical protein